MEILTNYEANILELITDGDSSYNLNSFKDYVNGGVNAEYHEIMLSVFDENNSFINSYVLSQDNNDFFIKNDQIYLKPNNILDRENFSEGNYNLQFDFLKRFKSNSEYYDNFFIIDQISQTRKEIRLRVNPNSYAYNELGVSEISDVNPEDSSGNTIGLSPISLIGMFLNDGAGTRPSDYTFNSFLEISQARLLQINNYAFDDISGGRRSLILKFNSPVPSEVVRLNENLKLVTKFYPSQVESIYFVNQEESQFVGLGLVPDQTFKLNEVSEVDTSKNYNELTSSIGTNVIDELNRIKKFGRIQVKKLQNQDGNARGFVQ